MTSARPPLKARRQLGAELRGARTLVGMTQRDLADRIDLNQPRVMRAEHGEALLPRATVLAWLDATDADAGLRERVLALTEAAHVETWPWQSGMADGHLQGIAATDEATAVRDRVYAMQWMPGLLQTAAYAQALLPQVDPTGEMDHPAAVAARLERQQALFREGTRFEFLIEEAALRWSPAAGVLAGQLDRVLSVATLPSVEIAVLPTERVGTSGWASFSLSTPRDGAVFATMELPHAGVVVSDPDAVAQYEVLWTGLWDAAAVGEDALALIHRARPRS